MMEAPTIRVIQRVGLASEPSNINCISWSTDNRLAIVTNGSVAILNINGVQNAEAKKGSKLKIKRNFIPAETKIEEYDVDIKSYDYEVALPMLSDSPWYSTANIDPALYPRILRQTASLDVQCAKWSPAGCDEIGRTNKLGLFVVDKLSSKWKEIANLSHHHYKQLKAEEFFATNDSMKGTPPPDVRCVIGENWKQFTEWQRRKYLLYFTCVAWYPTVLTCIDQLKKDSAKRKFVFLATMVKSGQLFIWQGELPLVEREVPMFRIMAAHTSMFYPCSLAWLAGESGASYLACGNAAGLIKVFFIKVSSGCAGLPVVVLAKAYTFVDVPDDTSVNCLAWHAQAGKLYLAFSKGPHVSVFHTQLMPGGILSKPNRQIVTGIHLLNVTALAISPSGTLFSTSAEGTVQRFTIGTRVRSTLVDFDKPTGFGYTGLACSPNGVFLAFVENRRRVLATKRNFTISVAQVAILSIIPEQENNQFLMSSISNVTDIPGLWDRFLFHEMSVQKLPVSSVYPKTLEGLSRSPLQLVRNILAATMRSSRKTNKEKGPCNFTSEQSAQLNNEEGQLDQDIASSRVDVAPKNEVLLENLDKKIGTLALERALVVIAERVKINQPHSFIFLGEPVVESIFRWLAQHCPSDSVTDFLKKIWSVCRHKPAETQTSDKIDVDLPSSSDENSTTGSNGRSKLDISTDIRKEILSATNFREQCMCREKIVPQELRFARCASGHVWPRCCVTFRPLNGIGNRVCQSCDAHALVQNTADAVNSDWTTELVKDSSSCSFCGGWFEYV